ncbi:MAG: hypothetical protein J0L92_15045 [Deltaproteobacteria bacterium]|nr:hypothetical protein [Deltaproteobacteria bacterium]
MNRATQQSTAPHRTSTDADPSLRGFDRAPSTLRLAALDVVLGAPETRCPIADRAVRIVRGGARGNGR